MARIVKAEFGHPANGEGGWYVEIAGTREEVMGEVGKALATESALAHGWAQGDRAGAGWPSSWNLEEDRRSFWFHGQGTWAYHLDCWCRHQFCPHAQGGQWRSAGCTADAPYRREAVPA